MGNRVFVATRRGLFVVDRVGGQGRARWSITGLSFKEDHIPMVLPDPRDGCVYAALWHGHFGVKLYQSQDGGETWKEIATPVYPKPGPGEERVNPWTQKTIKWKLVHVWSLEAGHADQPGVLWCGTIPGGLFRSHDSGASWELVRSLWDNPKRLEWFGGGAELPGIHSICVHPHDGGHLTLGVSCGGVWVSVDGGESWECKAAGMRADYMPPEKQLDPNVQDTLRVVQCPARPESLWAQHYNGIFRSTNGAASWQEIADVPPSSYGSAVAVHPLDPETAWLVPGISDERRIPSDGKVVVMRTHDGGKQFDMLHNGLPQVHAYDLTFRHALDIDDTGDSLAFGSTTGSLWISDDQGDSWQCVSEHLPPIHCVRFVK